MDLLHEIAVRAKYDGACTHDWAAIRSFIALESGNIPGKSDMQKLKTWAKEQGLLMDFEVEVEGFSSVIRTVTFWSGGEAAAQGDAAASEANPNSVGDASKEYFDWDAVGCR